jgi:hypothetical protein
MSAFRDPNTERLGDSVSIIRADRSPCPVCGHPTGDCTGDSPPPQKIIGLGGLIENLMVEKTVLIEETIYEERQITPFTKAKVVKHHKGSYVTVDEARDLGIL